MKVGPFSCYCRPGQRAITAYQTAREQSPAVGAEKGIGRMLLAMTLVLLAAFALALTSRPKPAAAPQPAPTLAKYTWTWAD